MTAISSRFLFELPNDTNVVKYNSPDNFLNDEDYGDGKRLVREQAIEYEDCDGNGDYEERPPVKKTKEPKRYSMMTGRELLRKKRLG
jgi:hypothetical protein